ncbi:MAG: serine--tRNA ligase [Thaumarchaeota archaeon]|nr:serine--tRNA ligase [Nitrososphaerota archaeon]MCY3976360.1 serine--tRNA ligase [Nitrososphaerota archaeon]
MLDPKLIRNESNTIRTMLKNRNIEFDLDNFLSLNKKIHDLTIRINKLRNEKNKNSYKIANIKKRTREIRLSEDESRTMIKQIQETSKILKILEEDNIKLKYEYNRLLFSLPNIIHRSVPIGQNASANKIIKHNGKIPIFNFKIQNHVEICNNLKLVDFIRASKVAGSRFYYLKDDLARLNQAIISYGLDFLHKKGYKIIQTPYMINKKSMEGAVIVDDFKDVIYKIENEDLYLIGTSEHAIASMHSNEILNGNDLPIKYAGFSTCFRKEAGAHGVDQKGIFRVHQFDKIEQFAFTKPENSWQEHEILLTNAEEFYQSIDIPYRIILLSSSDMGKISSKTYDIEAWMSGQKKYREIVSCSNCVDYQARRLKIRFRNKQKEKPTYVHTLNSTLVATSRILVAIIENFQTKDGHVCIPQVLQKYIGKHII